MSCTDRQEVLENDRSRKREYRNDPPKERKCGLAEENSKMAGQC